MTKEVVYTKAPSVFDLAGTAKTTRNETFKRLGRTRAEPSRAEC